MSKKAKESASVQKARNKLKKQLSIEHKKFTTEALEKMGQAIRMTINRHHPENSFLKKKKFTIFDENAHTAATKSKHILKLKKMLESSTIL